MVNLTIKQKIKIKDGMISTLQLYIKTLQLIEDDDITIKTLQCVVDILKLDIKEHTISSLDEVHWLEKSINDIVKGVEND